MTQLQLLHYLLKVQSIKNGNGKIYMLMALQRKRIFKIWKIYERNGNANGTFVYTGFKPAFVMVKKIDGTDDWL